MKANLINKYYKRDKVTGQFAVNSVGQRIKVYVYEITSATGAELTDYELHQGVNFVRDEETGRPLFYTTNFEGNHVDIVKAKGKNKDGALVSIYRALSSEDFELKRSNYERGNTPVVSIPAVNVNAATQIDTSGAEF